ncbi:hypothetical protein U14_00507 [Candidatus Moduliflexus flocculans]|uniref:STAS/SEC14 domain-containing protein n=1 Tax=Candidatus Moduliflexus flocculans TaxID=1499966 RepID=A0A0S6VVZ4_9BACT|nr:hypothetical protein U14_00507 [Candidatus Moduliflexus flocculans]
MNSFINEFVEVKVIAGEQTLSVTFLGFIPHKNLIDVVEHEYALISHYQIKKCFIDLRLIPVYDKGSKEYIKDIWFSRVIALGVRYVAFIVPEGILGQISMKNAHNINANTAITVEHFKEPEDAIKWLKTCE